MATQKNLKVGHMAENLIGSEIIKLGGEINERIKAGEKIFNFTIGDFDPAVFPIPQELNDAIVKAYQHHHTNYPTANGIIELRKSVHHFLQKGLNLNYSADEILITSGARPAIYATYTTLISPGDIVVFPTPSWNNNHYCHLTGATPVMIETKAENNFMPTADELKPHLHNATLLSLCSPLNPTGTIFSKQNLEEICDLVLEENKRRGENQKPLYLMYDQIYWVLTFGNHIHYNPVSLKPAMKDYTIFVDGISKCLAATGVRVGWAFGPQQIIDKMKAILSHVGAWAPKAEQVATAQYLADDKLMESYLKKFKSEIDLRLQGIYKGIIHLKNQGHNIDCIEPQAAIYLTLQFDLIGKTKSDGKRINTIEDTTAYLLDEAKLAIVPFYAFGSSHQSNWYRLSVGTCKVHEIEETISSLKTALEKLS